MAIIHVRTRDGRDLEIAAAPGESVMQALRDGGVDEILALCGGACACGTCHVYVDPAWAAKLGPMEPDEDDLLGAISHRTARSRLSCQLLVTDALAGLKLEVGPEE